MGDVGSSAGVRTFLGLSPMAEAIVLNFLEPESLFPWAGD